MRKEAFLVGMAVFLSGFCVALMVFFVWFEFVGKEVLVPTPPVVSPPMEIVEPSFPGNEDDIVPLPLEEGATGPIGGDRDEHGCIGSAGYTWCETKQKCLRSWEESCDSVSPDYESHGCSGFSGESWCEGKKKCLRVQDPEWDSSCEVKRENKQCRVQNCHGLDIECGTGSEQMCTMMYAFGDKCRQYASCEVVNDLCQQKKNPKFDTCKSCVQKCSTSYANDPVGMSSCEAKCG